MGIRLAPETAVQRARSAVPPEAVEVCARLREAGHGAWIVGGCLRDVLRGRDPVDWDVATTAEPPQVMRTFRRVIPTGVEHGTVLVRHRGRSFEVTTLRGETGYSDARRPDQVFFVHDIVQDLSRRDFTVNAMAFDPLTDVWVDPFCGLEDLAHRRLRTVGDPLTRFTEDGLRVLRAVRFVACLEFDIDPHTQAAIEPALPSFRCVSHERVRDEWIKASKAHRPSLAFALMKETGLLAEIHPELAARMDTSEPALWDAVLDGVDRCPPNPILRTAALLRNLVLAASDPQSALKRTDDWLRSYRFSNQERTQVVHWLRQLPETLTLPEEPVAIRRWMQRVGVEHADAVLSLAQAHAQGPSPSDAALVERLSRVHDQVASMRQADTPLRVQDLAIGGKDLMEHLGCAPGPAVGRVLRQLLERVVVDPRLNQRDRLLELAREQLSREPEDPPK